MISNMLLIHEKHAWNKNKWLIFWEYLFCKCRYMSYYSVIKIVSLNCKFSIEKWIELFAVESCIINHSSSVLPNVGL